MIDHDQVADALAFVRAMGAPPIQLPEPTPDTLLPGSYVIRPEVVLALGNGSAEAGARVLDLMFGFAPAAPDLEEHDAR